MVDKSAQGWVAHGGLIGTGVGRSLVMDSRWFDLFSDGYPENEGWIDGGQGQGMGQRSTLSLLGLRDGSFFSGCESSEDVFQVECACLCF